MDDRDRVHVPLSHSVRAALLGLVVPGLRCVYAHITINSLRSLTVPLCAILDPSVYTVMQEIVRHGATTESDQFAPEDVLLSIVYRFNNVSATTPPLSPEGTSFSADVSRPGTAGSQFSSESTVRHPHPSSH